MMNRTGRFWTGRLAVTALACASLVLTAGAASWAAATISFSKTTIDFGKVGQGKVVDLVYPFTNKGNSTLQIGQIHTSCGCTAATTSLKSVNPGQSGKITAKFNSGSFRGKIAKTISVETNDTKNPHMVLTVTGYVVPAVEAFPGVINFGKLKKGRKFQQTVVVKPQAGTTVTIKNVESRQDFVKVGKPRKSTKVTGAWEIPVTIDASTAPVGRRSEYINIRTDAPGQSLVVVRVIGEVTN